VKVVASEALQCPTLLRNGFGGHRIEGIGDKHVPWIHNVRNTDLVAGIDDNACMALLRLFNEPAGREWLVGRGVDRDLVGRLDLLGISGIANLLVAVRHTLRARPDDVLLTVATDSMELYGRGSPRARAARRVRRAARPSTTSATCSAPASTTCSSCRTGTASGCTT
jgi:hypothetical protein